MEPIGAPSTAVTAANERLLALRKQHFLVAQTKHHIKQLPPWKLFDDLGTESPSIEDIPSHLGWGSKGVTAVLRTTQKRANHNNTDWLKQLVPIQNTHTSSVNFVDTTQAPKFPSTVKLHHDLAIAMLRQELAASGRIWLLLRLIDQKGCGWVTIKDARQWLTEPDSELRVCGWRQLRNLLTKGKGIFWARDDERIWLNGITKIAYELGVERLSGLPVQIPVSALTSGIGDTKAHFYASLHSGRRHNNPISRATLAETTKVPVRTQIVYENKTRTQKRHNFAIGGRYSKEALEKRAWKHGRSTFKFADYKGMQGKAKQAYIAWRLPNSYTGSHAFAPKGRMRKINQQLKDLVNKRAQGNSSEMDCRVFYPDGAKAAKAYNSGSDSDIYWRSAVGKRPFALWNLLADE